MTNLVRSLGTDAFSSKFRGSFFITPNGKPGIMVGASGRDATVAMEISGRIRLRTEEIVIPASYFPDFSTFTPPPLGWRTSHKGRWLAYLERNNRSYHRGLAASNLSVELSPMSNWLLESGRVSYSQLTVDPTRLCAVTMRPDFIPLREGLDKMRRKEIMSFAVSPTIAVVPAPDEEFHIYFRKSIAGKVDSYGNVVTEHPFLNSFLEDN